MATTESKVFRGDIDRFKGITIRSSDISDIGESFSCDLSTSLKHWRDEGLRSVWFHVDKEQAALVPVLVAQGFSFHHVNTQSHLSLFLWMAGDKGEVCNIPSYAHTLIGVGGMVINEKEEILVVQERFLFKDTPHWKLPGGYVDPGEDLGEAAIREIREETGILTEFRSHLKSMRMKEGKQSIHFQVHRCLQTRPQIQLRLLRHLCDSCSQTNNRRDPKVREGVVEV